MKILGILYDFRIFFIGKGSFYRTLGKDKKFLSFRIITSYLKMSGMTCIPLLAIVDVTFSKTWGIIAIPFMK